MDVLEVVRGEIQDKNLLEAGTTVVVGVSGGPDSLCLLHLLNRLGADYDWSLYIAHLNHCLRGADSDEDMVFVALLAMDWDLPCIIEVANVGAIARQEQLSQEEAARQVRYGFLLSVARQVDATAVAVGHNADDQSETVLMHFLRGAGSAGLRGMSPCVDLNSFRLTHSSPAPSFSTSSVKLVRPLLAVPRTEIQDYCQTHDLSPRLDRSNLDTTHFRNRLRHQLLPLLETYNPNIKMLLRRTATVLAADYELLTAMRDEAWERLLREDSKSAISFDLVGWRTLPLALRRATLRQAAYRLCPNLRDVDFVHIEHAVNIATNGSTGAQATLPRDLRLTVGYQTLRLSVANHTQTAPDWPLLWSNDPLPVAVPGETALPGSQTPAPRPVSTHGAAPKREEDTHAGGYGSSGWWLEATLCDYEKQIALNNPDRWTAYLDADQLGTRLALRPRRPGDRFQPLGMDGDCVEVADFMVNAKIPRRWRGHIPLLIHNYPDCAGKEEIVWLVGWRIDERVKITARTRQVMRLRWHKRSHEKG